MLRPEQYAKQPSDARTDIYSLGMTMHQLVTGIDPKSREYVLQPIRKWNDTLSKGLQYIINKCIEVEPEKRYQNCRELLADLNEYQTLPKAKNIFGKILKNKKN